MVNPIDNHLTSLTEYGLLGVATSLVACAGALLAWRYWRRRSLDGSRINRRVLKRSLSIGVLCGGQMALKRLIDYHEARGNFASLGKAESDLMDLINQPRPDFIEMQRVISKLEMSGKDHNAVEKLELELKRLEPKRDSLKKYEFGMLLAEMLIYTGRYEDALKCECLKDDKMKITDARRPLFKAIIYILSEKYHSLERAEKCWKEFKEIREHFEWPPNLLEIQGYSIQIDFNKFYEVVKVLGDDIQKATDKNDI